MYPNNNMYSSTNNGYGSNCPQGYQYSYQYGCVSSGYNSNSMYDPSGYNSGTGYNSGMGYNSNGYNTGYNNGYSSNTYPSTYGKK